MGASFRVAICQPAIIYGGRLRVILGMVSAWNELGIVPDIVTADLHIRPEEIEQRYGLSLQANYVTLTRGIRLPGELAILAFNRGLKRLKGKYDLLINTGNSLQYLPEEQPVLSYLFFPRKARVHSRAVSIHRPEVSLSSFTRAGIERQLARLLYHNVPIHPLHRIICMTEFTREALLQAHGVGSDSPIVYPPVDFSVPKLEIAEKVLQIATMGRFVPDKRQLIQIEVAARLPEIPFHVLGFRGDGKYYERCQRLQQRLGVQNVFLRPDASWNQVQSTLRDSRYFLHTLVAEPFGLTTVQAIAMGCLPLVHDSGGQRETVPIELLRYQSIDEVVEKINYLETISVEERQSLLRKLRSNAMRLFSAEQFVERISAEFRSYL